MKLDILVYVTQRFPTERREIYDDVTPVFIRPIRCAKHLRLYV